MTHLATLELRLSNEKVYLSNAKSEKERALRSVWVKQIEKEIAEENAFLNRAPVADFNGSDDDLLKALES